MPSTKSSSNKQCQSTPVRRSVRKSGSCSGSKKRKQNNRRLRSESKRQCLSEKGSNTSTMEPYTNEDETRILDTPDRELAKTIDFEQSVGETPGNSTSILNTCLSIDPIDEKDESNNSVEISFQDPNKTLSAPEDDFLCDRTIGENNETNVLDHCLPLESSGVDLFQPDKSKIDKTVIKESNETKLFDDFNFTKNESALVNMNLTDIESSANSYPENTFYGLPMTVKDMLLQIRGIPSLYEWQNDCLNLSSVINRKNIVYSLPTSGGKTLVAEILMMQEILVKQRNVILVLPYVSIVQEKVRDLSPFAVQLGFHIEEYASRKGCLPPKKRRRKNSIFIATIEKANAIINSLVENERTEELGKVVVDELHMIGEGGGRAALLEILLTKIMFKFTHVQIIGMSATLGNMDDLKKFLNAQIFTNEFRPVELTEYVKLEDTLYKVDSMAKTDEELCVVNRQITHPVGFKEENKRSDPDHLCSLALEVIPQHSCMVFCATKKNCENVALLIAQGLPRDLRNHREEEKYALLQNIHNVANGVCKTLARTIPFGIAYHHSGLTMDERKLVEEAYSSGVLCLLCCTSTLAAGVNLPAKRVILRSPYVGNQCMSRAQYKQMIGRAGRAGIDSSGESILVIAKKDKNKLHKLIRGAMGSCSSSLMYEKGKGLRQLILSLLGLKICDSVSELENLLRTTLYHVQETSTNAATYDKENQKPKREDSESLFQMINKQIEALMSMSMISRKSSPCPSRENSQESITIEGESQTKDEQNKADVSNDTNDKKRTTDDPVDGVNVGLTPSKLVITDIGRATVKGCIDIDFVPTLYKDLKKSLQGIVLATELHLLYLATPIDQTAILTVKWMTYYRQFSKLNENETKAAEMIGIQEGMLMKKATGSSSKKFEETTYKRFYLTLMLYLLVKKKTIWYVAELFETTRGFLQNLLSSATSFTSLLVYFTAEIPEFWTLKLLFQDLVSHLTNTGDVDLLPLMEIPGVKQARARQLFKKGYHSLKDLASAEVGKLCQEIEFLPRKQANLIISSAKMLLQEKVEALREEADEIAGVSGDAT
ncbi:helicase POLQ-like [Clytia hemisphaerica]